MVCSNLSTEAKQSGGNSRNGSLAKTFRNNEAFSAEEEAGGGGGGGRRRLRHQIKAVQQFQLQFMPGSDRIPQPFMQEVTQ